WRRSSSLRLAVSASGWAGITSNWSVPTIGHLEVCRLIQASAARFDPAGHHFRKFHRPNRWRPHEPMAGGRIAEQRGAPFHSAETAGLPELPREELRHAAYHEDLGAGDV